MLDNIAKVADMSELFENSEIKSYYGDTTAMDISPCTVRIGEGMVSLTYAYSGGEQTYAGTEIGEGHYKLETSAGDGKANLHHFKGGQILDGWWVEHGHEGMWRITLHR